VYKVLALNCLVSAYMMSALYLRGLKQGDTQMTATGLVIAGLFFLLSQAKPVLHISAQKPTSTIFARAVLASLLGQFAVHFVSLLVVLHICAQHVAKDDFSLSADGKFQPNVVNSAVFLLATLMQINNFVVNYRGHPFTQSIYENITCGAACRCCTELCWWWRTGGQLEPLNDLLQMAPFPSPEFQALPRGHPGLQIRGLLRRGVLQPAPRVAEYVRYCTKHQHEHEHL
jgi:manganese-transporting P-type ATPase